MINALVYRKEEGMYDSPYSTEEFLLLPRAAEAITRIHRMDMLAIVVSNQPGVAKGKCEASMLDAITGRMCEELRDLGVALDDVFYCLHHPEATVLALRVNCDCRKPKPGLILQAARKHSIDLANSYMVGDTSRDIQAGIAAGCRTIMVEGPNGSILPGAEPLFQVRSLYEAAEKIWEQGRLSCKYS
ncbi:MAG: HAD-IIIA family hydrolase [Chloroflexi bacterium]|nr:HAD-IIIA family hydrolase [Chloroflexota bacterium]